MTTNTKQKIVELVTHEGQMRVQDLVRRLNLSNVAIHKQLKGLVEEGRLQKIGKAPLVFYVLTENKGVFLGPMPVAQADLRLLEQTYVYVSPVGEILSGLVGFRRWLDETKQNKYAVALGKEYVLTRKQADSFVDKDGLIEATEKLRNTFGELSVDRVFYKDFYALPKFGKTRLGQLVLYAKQAQNNPLISQIALEMRQVLGDLVKKHDIQAVAYIPHSLPRKVQFLKEFEARMGLSLPSIGLVKAYAGDIPVAQKSLSKLEERIENARKTIFVKTKSVEFDRVLLIDDAVGSGSTLNETARKLKEMGIAKKVIGFAIVGSMKGFEVIREV